MFKIILLPCVFACFGCVFACFGCVLLACLVLYGLKPPENGEKRPEFKGKHETPISWQDHGQNAP